MAQFYTLPTAIGEAKIANAIALGGTITISQLAVGDGGGTTPVPDSDRTSLVNEVRRAPINTSEVDPDNPNWIVVEQVLPPDDGGWTIREIGLFDADGDMIAYGNYPETYKPVLSEGSGRTQTIRFVMQVSDTAAVTLKVDPSVVLATRKYVDDQRTAHEASRNHPLATTTDKGMTQYATQQEHLDGLRTDRAAKPSGVKAMIEGRIADQGTVDAGIDDTKFVTAKKLKGWAVQWVKQATETVAGMLKIATQAQVDAGSDDTTAVTPKKLRGGVDYSIGESGYIAMPSWLGGLVIQWGHAINANAPYPKTFSFPIVFPNQALTIVGTDYGSGAHSIGIDVIDTATYKIAKAIDHTGAEAALTFNFIAVGR